MRCPSGAKTSLRSRPSSRRWSSVAGPIAVAPLNAGVGGHNTSSSQRGRRRRRAAHCRAASRRPPDHVAAFAARIDAGEPALAIAHPVRVLENKMQSA